jgi:sorbitol-specific phosphotransferase system component IIA
MRVPRCHSACLDATFEAVPFYLIFHHLQDPLPLAFCPTMKALLLLSTACLCFFSTTIRAQNGGTTGPTQTKPAPEEFLQDGIWTGSLKGGRYMVKAGQIIALSKHEYVVDAAARVVEVNLTLNTNSHVRFYFLEPVRLEGTGTIAVGQQAIDKARQLVQDAASRISPTLTEPKVVKSYPATTHTHTIEYVIKEEARLNSLFDSLEGAFRDPGRKHFWRE